MRIFHAWTLQVSDFPDNMYRYLQEMEAQIAVLLRRQHEIAQSAKSNEEHDVQYWLLGTMEESFPRNLRYGALVTIYATVEQLVRSACHLTGRVLGHPFVQPKGIGMLEGAAEFLSRTLAVEIIEGRVTWTPIKALRLLRHCVAHTAGHIPSMDDPDRLREAMRAFAFDLTEGSDGYLDIPREALPNILEAARGWLDEVLSDGWHEFVTKAGLEESGLVAFSRR